jgi:hypothetical protein
MLDAIYKFVFQLIVYGGGGAAIAYLLFQHLGKTWLENKFEQRLDELRHQQNIEMQRLRVEIDSLLSGSIRLQEKEFEILPQAWEKLDETYALVSWIVSPLQTYADVDRLNDEEIDEFLAATEFTKTQKNNIKNAERRSDEYNRLEIWRRMQKVRIAHGDLQAFVARNGILMPIELKAKLKQIVQLLNSALSIKQVGHENNNWELQIKGWDKLESEITPLYTQIEEQIQKRLLSHAKNE